MKLALRRNSKRKALKTEGETEAGAPVKGSCYKN